MNTLAERIAQIESILPQSALLEDIEETKEVLKEISASDLSIRFSLLLKIGSFYLESKDLD